LGIEPHLELWRYFFAVSLVKKKDRSTALIGCTRIHLRGPRAHECMVITTMKSIKGWHSWWFYIKNHDAAPLSLFTGRTIVAASPVWMWGPMDKEKKRLTLFLGAIAYLKGHDICGTGFTRAYHSRRVAPLMACALPLYGMVPGVQLEGTTLAQVALHDLEI
jgi:hypothetical protein